MTVHQLTTRRTTKTRVGSVIQKIVALQAAIEVIYNYENVYRGKGKSSEHNPKHMAVLEAARDDAFFAAFPRLAMRQKVEMLSKEIVRKLVQ